LVSKIKRLNEKMTIDRLRPSFPQKKMMIDEQED
jgi:hypothetical protein